MNDLQKLAAVFNEWARRYSESPQDFGEILDKNGKPVGDYGLCCATYFDAISKDLKVTNQ